MSVYFSSVSANIPLSLASAFATAIATVTDDIGIVECTNEPFSDMASALNSIITGTPTWLSPMPSDVQSFIRSVATAEASIINKDANAGARVDAVLKAGTAAVVGIAVGVVVML